MNIEIIGNRNGRLCVLNCMDSQKGLEIAYELLSWLRNLYCVHVVHHDGSRYEYDGLEYMKKLVTETGRPCLYLHTKGACNKPKLSLLVRKMWKAEFGEYSRASMYFDAVATDNCVVACPVRDSRNIPLYNGFVANGVAMKRASIVFSHEDRLTLERMWVDSDTDVRVMKYYGSLKGVHRFLEMEYGG